MNTGGPWDIKVTFVPDSIFQPVIRLIDSQGVAQKLSLVNNGTSPVELKGVKFTSDQSVSVCDLGTYYGTFSISYTAAHEEIHIEHVAIFVSLVAGIFTLILNDHFSFHRTWNNRLYSLQKEKSHFPS